MDREHFKALVQQAHQSLRKEFPSLKLSAVFESAAKAAHHRSWDHLSAELHRLSVESMEEALSAAVADLRARCTAQGAVGARSTRTPASKDLEVPVPQHVASRPISRGHPPSTKPPPKAEDAFHVIEIEGFFFWVTALGDIHLNSGGHVVLGHPVCIYEDDERWAVCKYDRGQARIDITQLSEEGRKKLAHEFGIPYGNRMGPFGTELFYQAPVFASLVKWVAAHPRLAARRRGPSTYLGNWFERAQAATGKNAAGHSDDTTKPPKTKPARARSVVRDALGYVDYGISMPAHDAHLLWLETHLNDVVRSLIPCKPWDPADIESAESRARGHVEHLRTQLQKDADADKRVREEIMNWTGLGDPPDWRLEINKPVLQFPLPANTQLSSWSRKTVRVVCYVDLQVATSWVPKPELNDHYSVRLPFNMCSNLPRWKTGKKTRELLFLVEPEIEGYAEVIQRIRAYEEHTHDSRFVVVCPDDTFAESFRGQGIRFVKCPPYHPKDSGTTPSPSGNGTTGSAG